MACGTPVVAFATSGLLDIVEHQRTGFLAKCFDTDDFAAGIAWVLSDDDRRDILSRQAREKAEREFKIQHVARQYLSLYKDIVNSKK